MSQSTFSYVIYIKTTPDKLWKALTDTKIVSQYWFGLRIESDWKAGSDWKFYIGDELMDSGKILKNIPKKLLVRSWRCEWRSDLKKEGLSRCSYEIEKIGSSMKLTIKHSMSRSNSKFIKAVSVGWPMCMSNLKSLLETGRVAMSEHPGH